MARMADYDYTLPADAIAQVPAEPRRSARMLVATDSDGAVTHARVADLAGMVGPGDVVVVNDTRVSPARLRLRKPSGGAIEVLLLERLETDPFSWQALLARSRRVRPGTTLYRAGIPVLEVGEHLGEGRRCVRLLVADLADQHGALALPPYLHQSLADPSRYQTVFACHPGSVAAPTAGLHLDHEVLAGLAAAGAQVVALDLSVGLDTFRPVTAERPEDHVIHTEAYDVPATTMEACLRARRVIAVGTTTVRALESAAASGCLSGRTSLFVHGDFDFQVVDLLLTNFHLPRSSLLLLVEALCGPRWRHLYRLALAEGYRFLSFGDAMLVARR